MGYAKNTLSVGQTLLGKVTAGTKTFSVFAIVLALGGSAIAQNTSNNVNGIPIAGVDNTGIGFASCPAMAAAGTANVGVGKRTLFANTTGSNNTAVGANSLSSNIIGGSNTAVGQNALQFNTASNNTGTGYQALTNNTAGTNNVADGYQALISNTTGSQNTGCGLRALFNNATGNNNTALGNAATTSVAALNNTTALGNSAVTNINDKIRLGNATVAVIEGQVAYTWPSDGRFKFNVTEEVKGLDFITKLRPVVYNFDTRKFEEFLTKNMSEQDRAQYLNVDFGPSTAIRQSGFIAQEVEVAAKQVGYNFNGVHAPVNENDNYSLAYAEFVVPLVKAVQEQQQIITTQQQQIDALQKQVALLANAQGEAAKVAAVNGVKMYPNPSEGMITIATPSMESASVEIYDMAGTRVYQSALKSGATSHAIDLSAYPRGMYSVKVMAKGVEVSTQKVVLQ